MQPIITRSMSMQEMNNEQNYCVGEIHSFDQERDMSEVLGDNGVPEISYLDSQWNPIRGGWNASFQFSNHAGGQSKLHGLAYNPPLSVLHA